MRTEPIHHFTVALEIGEAVVGMCQFRDYLAIITDRGNFYTVVATGRDFECRREL